MQSLRMRHCQWTGSDVLCEQATQVTAGDAEPLGKTFNIAVVKRAIGDQAQSSLHRGGCASPGRCPWCTLGPASQTGSITSLAGRRRGRVESDVLTLRWCRRTDWPAVDPGRADTNVETT